jgi:RNA polymerase sigma-70 factor, ECF subfamily
MIQQTLHSPFTGIVTPINAELQRLQKPINRVGTSFPLFFLALFELDNPKVSVSSTHGLDIPALIVRAQRGDSEAVGVLYQTFVQPIYRYIMYRVSTTADAEDLTAEVFVKMVEGIPTYQITGAPFEAWLYRIAAARVADFFRRTMRRPQTDLPETLSTDDPLPEERVVNRQELERLRKAVRQLSEEHQAILVLRFVERKSHEEVAVILSKSVTAVKSAQHRALSQLASLMEQNGKRRHYLRGSHE